MAKKIKQFRYYKDNDNEKRRNYPYRWVTKKDNQGKEYQEWESLINSSNLQSGAIFSEYMPVTQIGIQTIPGVKFNLNNSYSPIVIGFSGIYELDVNDFTEITSIQFDQTSLNQINNDEDTYLFVDIIYEEED